jgi:hypothetical protein
MCVVQDQRTQHKRPLQGRGSSKLKLQPPPGPGGLVESACHQSYIKTGTSAGNQTVVYSACFGLRNDKISKFITVWPNCELAENELLSPPPAQETERKELPRTSGRSSGADRRKD